MSSLNLFDAGKDRISIGFRGCLGSIECAQMLPALTTGIDTRTPTAMFKPDVLRRSGVQTRQRLEQECQGANRPKLSQVRCGHLLAMPFRLRTPFVGETGCGDCRRRNDAFLGGRHIRPRFGAGPPASVRQADLNPSFLRVWSAHARRSHAAIREIVAHRAKGLMRKDRGLFGCARILQRDVSAQNLKTESAWSMGAYCIVDSKTSNHLSLGVDTPEVIAPPQNRIDFCQADVGLSINKACSLVDAPRRSHCAVSHRISLTQRSLVRGGGAVCAVLPPRIIFSAAGALK